MGAGASDMGASGMGDLTSPFAWRFLFFLGASCGPSSKTSNSSSSMVGGAPVGVERAAVGRASKQAMEHARGQTGVSGARRVCRWRGGGGDRLASRKLGSRKKSKGVRWSLAHLPLGLGAAAALDTTRAHVIRSQSLKAHETRPTPLHSPTHPRYARQPTSPPNCTLR